MLSRIRAVAARRGVLGKLWPSASYVVTHITVTLFAAFFYVLNRTTVIGRNNLLHRPNTLLMSNHQSMLDSFLVGLAAFYPHSLWRPYLLPWNPAAAENFYKHPVLAWLAHHWRCIPVREGRRDLHALRRMIDALPRGVMTLFPEGTRTRTGEVGRGRTGAGLLILATRPTVVPVAIEGMREVLPIGHKIPRIGKRIHVSFGPPVDYSEFLEQRRDRDTAQQIVDKVMDRIRAQHTELRRLRAGSTAENAD
ncbi:MAG: lysophospholipid acyltransferase family protein [Gemmatimonadota bacterium]